MSGRKKVPLTRGVGGPVVGTCEISPNGDIVDCKITDPDMVWDLTRDLAVSFAIGLTPEQGSNIGGEQTT
jgi:hypothetical protein